MRRDLETEIERLKQENERLETELTTMNWKQRSRTIERCAQAIPTNWLDPLLTGDGAPKLPLNGRGVEDLLLRIKDRILALKDKP